MPYLTDLSILCSCGCDTPLSLNPSLSPPPSRCSVCRSTFYVDRSHQLEHFKQHKIQCAFMSLVTVTVNSSVYANKDVMCQITGKVVVKKGEAGRIIALQSDLEKQYELLNTSSSCSDSDTVFTPGYYVHFTDTDTDTFRTLSVDDLFWKGTSAGSDTNYENLWVEGSYAFFGCTSSSMQNNNNNKGADFSIQTSLSNLQSSLALMRKIVFKTVAKDDPMLDSLYRLLGRRSLFLSFCLIDSNEITDARAYLTLSLKCLTSLSSHLQIDKTWGKACYTELMLSYEDEGDMLNASKIANECITSTPFLQFWTHDMQRPGYMWLNLTSLPFWSTSEVDTSLEWVKRLETPEIFNVILNELNELQERAWNQVGGEHRDGSGQHDASVLTVGSEWKELVLFGRGGSELICPSSCKILREICGDEVISLCADGGGEVIFSRLSSGSHILPHCAPTNHRLTCHLGLKIPVSSGKKERCSIRVGREWKDWEVGKCIVFDDSYEHEVINSTPTERIILLIRFWHPSLNNKADRTAALKEAIEGKEDAVRARWIPPFKECQQTVERMLPLEGEERRGAVCRGCGDSSRLEIRVVEGKGKMAREIKVFCSMCEMCEIDVV